MLTTQVFSLGPHSEHITDTVVHLERPAPPATRVSWPNSEPSSIAIELAVDHGPPRRTFSEKTVPEMAIARRPMPRPGQHPHIAKHFERTKHRLRAIDTSTFVRRDPVEARRIPHAHLIEQAALQQPPARYFVAGEHTSHCCCIAKPDIGAQRSGNENATVSASVIENVGIGIDEGQRPSFGLIRYMAATVCMTHGRILAGTRPDSC